MKTKRYLIVDGKTFPVMGISFKEDGNISTIQIYDDFKLRSFVNIDVETEGFEKVDFNSCYVEENTEAEEILQDYIDFCSNKLHELAHNSIPPLNIDISLEDFRESWVDFHISTAYLNGLVDAFQLITNGEDFSRRTTVH